MLIGLIEDAHEDFNQPEAYWIDLLLGFKVNKDTIVASIGHIRQGKIPRG